MGVKNKALVEDLKNRLNAAIDDYEWYRKKIIFVEEQITQLRYTISELEKG